MLSAAALRLGPDGVVAGVVIEGAVGDGLADGFGPGVPVADLAEPRRGLPFGLVAEGGDAIGYLGVAGIEVFRPTRVGVA